MDQVRSNIKTAKTHTRSFQDIYNLMQENKEDQY